MRLTDYVDGAEPFLKLVEGLSRYELTYVKFTPEELEELSEYISKQEAELVALDKAFDALQERNDKLNREFTELVLKNEATKEEETVDRYQTGYTAALETVRKVFESRARKMNGQVSVEGRLNADWQPVGQDYLTRAAYKELALTQAEIYQMAKARGQDDKQGDNQTV